MSEYQALYPIPQTEIDVAPGVTQSPAHVSVRSLDTSAPGPRDPGCDRGG
jgi:hypothetical protein